VAGGRPGASGIGPAGGVGAMSHASTPPRLRSGPAIYGYYILLIGAAAAAFFAIDDWGRQLEAPLSGPAVAAQAAGPNINALFHLLLALVVIMATARLVGVCFMQIGQPPVIGEVIGGIMLGPSLLGRVAPDLYTQLLPASLAPILGLYAQLGVIIYMFLVGLELDLSTIKRSGHATIAISHASIIVPFLSGTALALVLYPVLAPPAVSFTVFALFLGVSMSVTAFPVLARILTDCKISRSHLGTIALACAAVDDATAWCLLALVVSIAQARAADALQTLLLTGGFVALVLGVGLPIVRRLVPRLERSPELGRTGLTVLFVVMLMAAMTTEYIGIHALFGAFLFGAIIPHRTRIASELNARLDGVVGVLFLPAFFALTGMRTQLGLVSGTQSWLLCGAIILVACLGKFGGTLLAARGVGFSWENAAALGALMNTRGLVELIVLNIGLDLGVISPTLFTMLVIMALVTTMMTTPLLRMILRGQSWAELKAVSAVAHSG
jgi:Kef-type K+ transport system membrane component KefB